MPQSYIKKILKARVYDVAIESPVDHMPLLSKRLNNEILLKREDLQPVFSFKLRGAYNKMMSLSEEERSKGVVAASAGNHAQGLALSALKLGVRATIVMPRTTPQIKVDAVRARGGYGGWRARACDAPARPLPWYSSTRVRGDPASDNTHPKGCETLRPAQPPNSVLSGVALTTEGAQL